MIIQNRSTEVGDVMYIKTDTPLIGLIALLSFVDDTEGEYADRSFKKTFRYSVDGVTWTQFVPLTNDNVAGVQVNSTDTFYAEYFYERIGIDTTGELEFNSVTLNGEYILPTDGPAYNASIFPTYFPQNNICSIAWSVNVLEKLYKKGIIPNYIERNLSGDNATDRDFLDFWRGITHYFALYVCLARQFQFFYQNPKLLLEYIKQRGLFVCDDISYTDLFYLMSYFYDEIRQRGTRQVFVPKALDITVEGSKQVDGEYLRMICYDRRDEFLRNLNLSEHIGWNIGNSSPLYKGLEGRLNVNKYYVDYVDDILSIQDDISIADSSLPYVTINENSLSHSTSISSSNSNSVEQDKDILIIRSPGNGNSEGIGRGSKRIVVNPNLDYEVTFFVKANGTGSTTTSPATLSYSTAGWSGGSGTYRISVSFSFFVSGSTNNFITPFVASIAAGFANLVSQINTLYGSVIASYSGNTFTMINVGQVGAAGNGATASFFAPSGIDPPLVSPPTGAFSGGVTGSPIAPITFGVNCYNQSGFIIDPINIDNGGSNPNFLLQQQLNKKGTYYFVRGIIYSKNSWKPYDASKSYDAGRIVVYLGEYYRSKRSVPVDGTEISLGTIQATPGGGVGSPILWDFWEHITFSEAQYFFTTNLGVGKNLMFDEGIIEIDPYILYDNNNNSTEELYLYDIRVQPLSTPYSKGFIQSSNLLEIWSTNNNLNVSENKIEKDTKKYLIPYNTVLKSNFTPSAL